MINQLVMLSVSNFQHWGIVHSAKRLVSFPHDQ